MATRKRPTAAREAEQAMKGVLNTMERLLKSPPPNLHGMANRLAVAADHMADALDRRGLKCIAKPPPGGSRALNWSVTCAIKRKNVSGLSGPHCRDSSGEFVPIPRCTGRKRKTKTA